jgi:hypothetical protein
MNQYISGDLVNGYQSTGLYTTSGLVRAYPGGSELRLTEAKVQFLPDQQRIQMTVTVWQHKKRHYSKGFYKISHVVLVDGETIQHETSNSISFVDWHGSRIPIQALLEFCEIHNEPKKPVIRKFRKAFRHYDYSKTKYWLKNSKDHDQYGLKEIRNPDFQEHNIVILE